MPAVQTELAGLAAQTLLQLCIPPHLLGYHYLVYAVEKVAIDPLRIKGLTTALFPEIAQRYDSTVDAVIRDIRTAIKSCWARGGKEKLGEMCPYHLTQFPWPSEFIAIVAMHVAKKHE